MLTLLYVLFGMAHAIDYFQDFEAVRKTRSTCGDPPPVANTYRWMNGSLVQYACVDGYYDKLNRTEFRHFCDQSDGIWSGDRPLCELDCGLPTDLPLAVGPTIAHDGKVLINDAPDFGVGVGTYTFTCTNDSMHFLNTSSEFSETCEPKQGKWSGPAAYCIYKDSLDLIAPTFDTTVTEIIDGTPVTCGHLTLQPSGTVNVVYNISSGEEMDISKVLVWYKSTVSTYGCFKKYRSYNPNGHPELETLNVTKENWPCMNWEEVIDALGEDPDIYAFPDADISNAENFCRNPKIGSKTRRRNPWCYINRQGDKRDCNVPHCSELYLAAQDDRVKNSFPWSYNPNFLSNPQALSTGVTEGLPNGREIRLKFVTNEYATRDVTLCDVVVYGRPKAGPSIKEPYKGNGYTFIREDEETDENIYACAEGYLPLGDKSVVGKSGWDREACIGERNIAENWNGTRELTDGDENTCLVLDTNSNHTMPLDAVTEISHLLVVLNPPPLPARTDAICLQAEVTWGNKSTVCDSTICSTRRFLFSCPGIPTASDVTVISAHNETVSLCEIQVFGRIFDDTLECKRLSSGIDYKGVMNMTMDGEACLNWSNLTLPQMTFPDHSMEEANNYCRNPIKADGNPFDRAPICHYMSEDGVFSRKQCGIPLCTKICRLTPSGTDFMGDATHTKDGLTCVKWDWFKMPQTYFTRDSYFPEGTSSQSKCRNPLKSQDRPWCFVQDPAGGKYYDYCRIPTCPLSSTVAFEPMFDLYFPDARIQLYNLTTEFHLCSLRVSDDKIHLYYDPWAAIMARCDNGPGSIDTYLCRFKDPDDPQLYPGDSNSWLNIELTCPPPPTTTVSTTTVSTTTAAGPLQPTPEEKVLLVLALKNMTIIYGLCPQDCSIDCFNRNISSIISQLILERAIRKIHQELLLPTVSLSKTIRAKISAPDPRASSQSAGYLAVLLLVGTLTFIVFADVIRIYQYFHPDTPAPATTTTTTTTTQQAWDSSSPSSSSSDLRLELETPLPSPLRTPPEFRKKWKETVKAMKKVQSNLSGNLHITET